MSWRDTLSTDVSPKLGKRFLIQEWGPCKKPTNRQDLRQGLREETEEDEGAVESAKTSVLTQYASAG